jgi:hypothetical protein
MTWLNSHSRSAKRGCGRRPKTTCNPLPKGRSFLPRLEALEDRTVPSTLTVLNTLDKGDGSLRDVITRARDGDSIVFDAGLNGQTITLTSDQLTIRKNLDIEGPGTGLLAISGNDTNRVFAIEEGHTVRIAGLTITHGRSVGGSFSTGGGGAIQNVNSNLALANDVFSDNVDLGGEGNAKGGAVSNAGAAAVLTVTDSAFLGNRADGAVKGRRFAEGGAIWNDSDGSSITVVRCTFIGNQALVGDGSVATSTKVEVGEANGGALHNEGTSTLTVVDSIFVGNLALGGNGGSAQKGLSAYVLGGGFGGAIADDDSTGLMVVTGCTFSYNQAIGGSDNDGNATGQGVVGVGSGGALGIIGPATVTNCTFDHNAALGGSGNGGGSLAVLGRGVGGAIQNVNFSGGQAALTVSGCTFTNNRAVGGSSNTGSSLANQGLGGAIDNARGATATVTGSTFNGNQAVGGQGGAGQQGGDGLGGALANFGGSSLGLLGCTLDGNQAVSGAGGSGANGGNGLGGGAWNDGRSTLTILTSTITANGAAGGTAGLGGSAGDGVGGGAYLVAGGTVCLDAATLAAIFGNLASTSDANVFGGFTICS